MKHFKPREKPEFCFVDWPVLLDGWTQAQAVVERGQSRAPVHLAMSVP